MVTNLSGRIPTRGNPLKIPTIVEITDSDPLLGYRICDRDSGNGDFNYYGYMKKDGSFYIMREEVAVGAYRYYQGNIGSYATDWVARKSGSITYSYLNVAFS
jgi:hypothetical protein